MNSVIVSAIMLLIVSWIYTPETVNVCKYSDWKTVTPLSGLCRTVKECLECELFLTYLFLYEFHLTLFQMLHLHRDIYIYIDIQNDSYFYIFSKFKIQGFIVMCTLATVYRYGNEKRRSQAPPTVQHEYIGTNKTDQIVQERLRCACVNSFTWLYCLFYFILYSFFIFICIVSSCEL